MEFTCQTCGKQHDISEISFGADAPVQWTLISDTERKKCELGDEQCVIKVDGETHFFIRACLEIPIKGATHPFTWGVWVSLSEKNFLEISDHWENPSRQRLGPYFGWLCTKIPEYPDTVFMKTMVHQRAVGQRPVVELDETDHPLSVDQRNGIDPKRMQEIISKLLHMQS
jgi:hypothetical protein